MKKILIVLAAVAALSSCSTTIPYTATSNAIGSKKGVSKTGVILGSNGGDQLAMGLLVTNGKFGVIDAAKNGNISKISTVDVKSTNYLIFRKVEVIVTGE